MPSWFGWTVMEAPAVAVCAAVYLDGKNAGQIVPLAFLAMWQVHYLNRTFVYPLRARKGERKMPVLVAGSAIFFNIVNAYINARFVSEFGQYAVEWLYDLRFLFGLAVFAAGMALNRHSDTVLMRLRRLGETGYAIPHGGGYRYVS